MLKNKIYKYFTKEILKSFIVILFAFTAIAWTVRAVNFLDLIVDDGHSLRTYLLFSALNITSIVAKFIPLSFLIALIISILKFERQNELIILWTSGLSKLNIVNLFFLISLIVTIFQLIFSIYITPKTLFKSRDIIKSSDYNSLDMVIRTNNFNDTFKDLVIFFEKRTEENYLENIFIKDYKSYLGNIVNKKEDSENTTIIAKKGFVDNINNKKLILYNGLIQSQNKVNEIETVNFEKTEIILNNLDSRSIIVPKTQETSTFVLLDCLKKSDGSEKIKSCPKNNDKKNVIEHVSRRMGAPLYIPLVSIICSFLLFTRNNKKFKNLNRYTYFFVSFIILVFAEILVRFSGFSTIHTIAYFATPMLLMLISYLIIFYKIRNEKINI